jgi:DNA-binding response OmpR family regulator
MKKVLVIDDEPGIGRLVSWCLDPLGVEVVLADGLESAVAAAGAQDIGLVLLDFDLGPEDGLEILPDLRAAANLDGVAVVGFSAHDSRRDEAFQKGVVDFVNRPFMNAALREAVKLHMSTS